MQRQFGQIAEKPGRAARRRATPAPTGSIFHQKVSSSPPRNSRKTSPSSSASIRCITSPSTAWWRRRGWARKTSASPATPASTPSGRPTPWKSSASRSGEKINLTFFQEPSSEKYEERTAKERFCPDSLFSFDFTADHDIGHRSGHISRY